MRNCVSFPNCLVITHLRWSAAVDETRPSPSRERERTAMAPMIWNCSATDHKTVGGGDFFKGSIRNSDRKKLKTLRDCDIIEWKFGWKLPKIRSKVTEIEWKNGLKWPKLVRIIWNVVEMSWKLVGNDQKWLEMVEIEWKLVVYSQN